MANCWSPVVDYSAESRSGSKKSHNKGKMRRCASLEERAAVEAVSVLDSLEAKDLIMALATVIDDVMSINDMLPTIEPTPFHSCVKAEIPVQNYLERIAQYAPCSNESLLNIIVYLDLVSTRSSALCLCSLNVHRLILVAVMVSAKFTEDKYYTNKHYARVGGLPVLELNKLEVLFLEIAGYAMWPQPTLQETYFTHLMAYKPGEMGTAPSSSPVQLFPALARSAWLPSQQTRAAAYGNATPAFAKSVRLVPFPVASGSMMTSVFGPVFMTPQQTLQVHAPPPPSLATYWPPAATMAAIQSRHELEHNLSMQEFAIARQQEMVAKQQLGTSLLPDEDQPPATAALSAHVTAVAKQHQQGQQQRMELMQAAQQAQFMLSPAPAVEVAPAVAATTSQQPYIFPGAYVYGNPRERVHRVQTDTDQQARRSDVQVVTPQPPPFYQQHGPAPAGVTRQVPQSLRELERQVRRLNILKARGGTKRSSQNHPADAA